jgi:hypothetical protein
MPIQVL